MTPRNTPQRVLTTMTLDTLTKDFPLDEPEVTFDSETLTRKRFHHREERKIANYGAGASSGGLAIAERYLEETKLLVDGAVSLYKRAKDNADIKHPKGAFHGVPKEVFLLDPYVVSLAGIHAGISCIARCDSVSATLFKLGMAIEDEVYAYLIKNWDAVKAKRVRDILRQQGSVSQRRKVMMSVSRDMGFVTDPWAPEARLAAGKWLIEILLASPVFVMADTDDGIGGYLALTEEAHEYSLSIIDKLLLANPALLPPKAPPAPWAGPSTHIDGYRVNLVRSFQKPVHRAINGAIKTGRMKLVLDAVNAIQGVPWRINTNILDMVEWAYDNGVSVPGLPSKDDLPVPQWSPEEWAEMDEELASARRKDIAGVKKRNRGFIGERQMYDVDMRTAHHLKDGNYYTPVNMDYRGRVYGLTYFQFQRQDYVRAMFMFAEGKPVDTEGLYWLKVHVANTGAYDKIDKASFEDRVSWVDTHLDDIYAMVTDPKENLWWTKADSPFMFLAACLELARALVSPGYICHLPVSFDGTCSGLQHLAAMTRDEETGYYVNLRPTPKPQDIYSIVADLAKTRIEKDALSSSTSEIALLVLGAGVGRSLVKRNVMTYSYSSGKFGMAEQHMEDTMVPLRYEVMSGKRSVHPYQHPNDTFQVKKTQKWVTIPGFVASKYLASVIHGAIEEVVRRPADAMKYLQQIANCMSHEEKPVVWHTPLGMPVVLRYPNTERQQVQLFLQNDGVRVRVQPSLQNETTGIDRKRAFNAIAPSFVHSLDACHLQMSVLAANEDGISNVALVHDSFGCLPSDATKFRQVILSQFIKLYGERDVLLDIREEARGQLDDPSRLPELPEYGDLDINEVAEATYAFA